MLHKVHNLPSPMRVESHARASRKLILRDATIGEFDCGGRNTLLQDAGIDLKNNFNYKINTNFEFISHPSYCMAQKFPNTIIAYSSYFYT
jgi:hypothetical protein